MFDLVRQIDDNDLFAGEVRAWHWVDSATALTVAFPGRPTNTAGGRVKVHVEESDAAPRHSPTLA